MRLVTFNITWVQSLPNPGIAAIQVSETSGGQAFGNLNAAGQIMLPDTGAPLSLYFNAPDPDDSLCGWIDVRTLQPGVTMSGAVLALACA